MMELSEIRVKLDELDKELVEIIKKRMDLIPHVAEYKKGKGIPRYQPEREAEIIKAKRELAEEVGVSPDLIEDIIKRLIEESHEVQKGILEK